MIQLQSVSESLVTLNICTDLTLISSDFSDENRISLKYHITESFRFLFTPVYKVTDSLSFTVFLLISYSCSAAETPETQTNR